MGCAACQDCNCDNITLPVITGPTGPAGAAGTNGTNGTNGVTILMNDTSLSNTTSSSISLFTTTKSYTLAAGTLTNGSKLKVKGIFKSVNTVTGEKLNAYVYINGSSFTANTIPYQMLPGKGQTQLLKIELDITKIDKSTLFIDSVSLISDVAGWMTSSYSFVETAVTVTNIDANSLIIDFRGQNVVAGTHGLDCLQMTVEQHIK